MKQQAEDIKTLKIEEEKLSQILTERKPTEENFTETEPEPVQGQPINENSIPLATNEIDSEPIESSMSQDVDKESALLEPSMEAGIPSEDVVDANRLGGLELESTKKRKPAVSSKIEIQPEKNITTADNAETELSPSETGTEKKEQKPAVSPLLPIRGIRKYPLKVSGGYLFICKCPGAKTVQVVGDFTNWIAVNMNSPGGKSGFWTRVFSLTPGSHKYKFIVDGEWVNDINNSKYLRNPYGGIDSIVEVA